METNDLGIAERLKRKMGRPARTQSMATRFTVQEELELLKAAERQGQTVREWTREALLREARRPQNNPIFTEVIATRITLNLALEALSTGKKWTPEYFQKLTNKVQSIKRQAGQDILATYTTPPE